MKYAVLFASLLLLGCGTSEEDRVTTQDSEKQDEEGVFDPMVNTIDRANQVEDTVMQRKEEMDRRMQELEGETSNDKKKQ